MKKLEEIIPEVLTQALKGKYIRIMEVPSKIFPEGRFVCEAKIAYFKRDELGGGGILMGISPIHKKKWKDGYKAHDCSIPTFDCDYCEGGWSYKIYDTLEELKKSRAQKVSSSS